MSQDAHPPPVAPPNSPRGTEAPYKDSSVQGLGQLGLPLVPRDRAASPELAGHLSPKLAKIRGAQHQCGHIVRTRLRKSAWLPPWAPRATCWHPPAPSPAPPEKPQRWTPALARPADAEGGGPLSASWRPWPQDTCTAAPGGQGVWGVVPRRAAVSRVSAGH